MLTVSYICVGLSVFSLFLVIRVVVKEHEKQKILRYYGISKKKKRVLRYYGVTKNK